MKKCHRPILNEFVINLLVLCSKRSLQTRYLSHNQDWLPALCRHRGNCWDPMCKSPSWCPHCMAFPLGNLKTIHVLKPYMSSCFFNTINSKWSMVFLHQTAFHLHSSISKAHVDQWEQPFLLLHHLDGYRNQGWSSACTQACCKNQCLGCRSTEFPQAW